MPIFKRRESKDIYLSHFKTNWEQISIIPSYIFRIDAVPKAGISNRSSQDQPHVRRVLNEKFALTSDSPIGFLIVSSVIEAL